MPTGIKITNKARKEIVEAYKGGMSVKEIATCMNISQVSVWRALNNSGVTLDKGNWTTQEDSRLIQLRRMSMTWKQISKQMGGKRSAKACQLRWLRLQSATKPSAEPVTVPQPEQPRKRRVPTGWRKTTPQDKAQIRNLFRNGLTVKQICEVTGFSPHTVGRYAKDLRGKAEPIMIPSVFKMRPTTQPTQPTEEQIQQAVDTYMESLKAARPWWKKVLRLG